ncbi:MAG: hypothetical protein ABSD57_06250 [Verrucomicrobiota bacterium]|jgi:hypothetical protein
MSLEVHVYGSGFGETIFLRWPRAEGGWRGALVDAHSPQEGRWLVDKLRVLQLAELEFVVATHPHLDHIFNLAAGLHLAGVRIGRGLYWPGLTPGYWMQFFGKLAAQRGGDLPQTASMIRQLFNFLSMRTKQHDMPAHDIGGSEEMEAVLESDVNGEHLRFRPIGPWLPEMNKLVQNVSGSIASDGRIDYEHRDANSVSIALLIEYGNAQVVLGSDMEIGNWDCLRAAKNHPFFRPSVVKVSHHGSSNGRTNTMWPANKGFFDGMGAKPIAIVTPWRQGGRSLPDESVLKEIRRAGFTVYVTGHGATPRYRDPDSHVSIRVTPDGAMEVFEQSKVRILEAVTTSVR